MEPICIGCRFTDFIGGVEWISRLWSSKSANIKPSIIIVNRCVKGGAEKEIRMESFHLYKGTVVK